MCRTMGIVVAFAVLLSTGSRVAAAESADLAHVETTKITLGQGEAERSYYLITGKPPAGTPEGGFGLAIVLPGGSGKGGSFLSFTQRIKSTVLDATWLVAVGVAKQWTPQQRIVWPTKTNPVTDMAISTEGYVDAVFKDVSRRHKIDKRRVVLMGWSSSGTACYTISLSKRDYIAGYFILMSVFDPDWLPSLMNARGQSYYILHGRQDRRCPARMARLARRVLAGKGARVEYVERPGGHGFQAFAPVFPMLRRGFDWLAPPGRPPAASRPDQPASRATSTSKPGS